mmetsp:Transcript_15356/g.19193  ORF Transcript_15356/g.19193 Transcript_15356/m.19193 type:complete len:102 (+) Transcript_15356:593-898(+)
MDIYNRCRIVLWRGRCLVCTLVRIGVLQYCRKFTPAFVDSYKKLKNQGKEFEVVFVSSDRSEADFNEYHSSQAALVSVAVQRKGRRTRTEPPCLTWMVFRL